MNVKNFCRHETYEKLLNNPTNQTDKLLYLLLQKICLRQFVNSVDEREILFVEWEVWYNLQSQVIQEFNIFMKEDRYIAKAFATASKSINVKIKENVLEIKFWLPSS